MNMVQGIGEHAGTQPPRGNYGKTFVLKHLNDGLKALPLDLQPRVAVASEIRSFFQSRGLGEKVEPTYTRPHDKTSPITLGFDTFAHGAFSITLINDPPQLVIDARNVRNNVAKDLNDIYANLKMHGVGINPLVLWNDGKTYTMEDLPKDVLKSTATPVGDPIPRLPFGGIVNYNNRILVYIGNDAFYDPSTQDIVELTEQAIQMAQTVGGYSIRSLPDSPWSNVIRAISKRTPSETIGNSTKAVGLPV